MHTGCCIVCPFDITGPRCSHTSNEFAVPAPVALSPIRLTINLQSWFTAFPSAPSSKFSSSMVTLPANHPALKRDCILGMTGFAVMEPVKHTKFLTFASALMKVQLRFGLCHTIVLNKDTKFFGTFKEACDLLQLDRHVLTGYNHNLMMVECINRYLNKGMKSWQTSKGPSELPWKQFSSFHTRRTVHLFLAITSPVALLH